MHDDGDRSSFRGETSDHLEQLERVSHVEGSRRFVQEQRSGARRQRARDEHPCALPERKRGEGSSGEPSDVHPLHGRAGNFVDVWFRAEGARAGDPPERDDVLDG
ncbi:MAG: hypothetical protein MUE69_07980 [Myxococcota bacterium]|nr:hypothetical protein [Myxococcota bacterium]